LSANSLELLGMARRSGRLICGIENAVANARSIVLILVSSDIGSAAERKAKRLSEATNVKLIKLPYTTVRLGAALGLHSCSVIGVADKGFATNIQYQLEQEQ